MRTLERPSNETLEMTHILYGDPSCAQVEAKPYIECVAWLIQEERKRRQQEKQDGTTETAE